MNTDPPFVRRLPSLTTESDHPLELTPQTRAELDKQLAAIDEARARAAAAAHSYVVWR